MQRVKLGLVCLSWFCLAGAVTAQSQMADSLSDSTSGIAAVQNFSGGAVFNGTYLDIRHVIGDGVGWVNSYSQIGAFTPVWINDDAFIAPNARLIITNSTQTGVNAGLVGRQYVESLDRIFGVYGYYDNDQNQLNNRYQQFTVGAESLGRWFDVRGNGYFLDGPQSNLIGPNGLGNTPFFVGNFLAFQGMQLRDQALGGGDFEVGAPVSPATPWLRAYAGLYGYQATQVHVVGFRGRLEATVSNDLTVGMMVTQDDLFGTNLNGVIEFKFSGFRPTVYFPRQTTRQRMLNPVQRNWRIATHTYNQAIDIDAINPATNQPYFITHVDNNAAAGGNGTIEHPFNHLVSSPQADIILVHLGHATTPGGAVTGSTVLVDNQRLLGTGIQSTVPLTASYGNATINGTYVLPGTANTFQFPFVTNPTGNTVTLANNNEVAGLNLVNAGGSAIVSNGSNNFNLHDLGISGSTQMGISLANASGTGNISNINDAARNALYTSGLGNNVLGGIQVATGGSGLNLGMSNVYMNASSPAQQAFGLNLIANNAPLNVSMGNVFANGNTNGILMNEIGQAMNVQMNINPDGTNNNATTVQAENNGGVGIQVLGTGGQITLTANNVVAYRNNSDNLQIGTPVVPITNATVNATISNSTFASSQVGSGIVFNQSGGQGTLNLLSDIVTRNGGASPSGNGLEVLGSNAAQITAVVNHGLFTINNGDAFHVVGSSGANLGLAVGNTNASGSVAGNGLYYSLTGTNTQLHTDFENDHLDFSGQSAVHGELANAAAVNLLFNNTTAANSGGDGFFLNAMSNSVAQIVLNNGTFANSGTMMGGAAAFDIESVASNITLTATNTVGSNFISPSGPIGNQAYGLKMNIQNGSVFNGTFTNGDFSKSLTNAVDMNVASATAAMVTTANLTLAGTSGNNSGAEGIVATVTGVSTAPNNTTATITLEDAPNGSHSLVNNSGKDGVNFNVNAGQLTLNATNSTFDQLGHIQAVNGSGVLGVVTNSGLASLNFTNTQINNNLDNGVYVATNGANVRATFVGGTIDANGVQSLTTRLNDGVLLNLTNANNSLLNMTGTSVISNGNDGIAVIAANSIVNGSLNNLTVTNNGAYKSGSAYTPTSAGIDLSSRAGSNITLGLTDVTSGNTGLSTTQQIGLLVNAANTGSQVNLNVTGSNFNNNAIGFDTSAFTGSSVTGMFTNSSLSNNSVDAVVATVSGIGTTTTLGFSGVTADTSGSTAGVFSVTGGGVLTVGMSNASSFSDSGGAGILAVVAGVGSKGYFDIDSTTITNNGTSAFGGQGISAILLGGGELDAVITNSTITSNSLQGIDITADGAGTIGYYHVQNSTIDANRSEGLLIAATNGAEVNYRSVDNSYSNNGSNGNLSGVNLSADNATVRTLFSGDTIDGNAGNGITLTAANGATLTTSLNNIDDSNNGGFGIQSTATGATTNFNLIMTGNNTFNNNALGAFSPFTFSNINSAALLISGSFNGNTGDGLDVNLSNIPNAAVAIIGGGTDTVDNNGGNGIEVNMTNITTSGSLLISGYKEMNNNGGDGILVNMTNVASGALEINGPTSINNSGVDAIDANLTNTALVNSPSFASGSSIKVLTLVNNLTPPPPIYSQLPMPVNSTIGGLAPSSALVINDIAAAGSGAGGISVNATNTTIQANGSFITGNTVAGSKNGDGIFVGLTGSTADGLTIANNGSQSNTGNGLNVVLSNTPITGLTISGNNASNSASSAAAGISGNTLDGVRISLNSSSLTNATFSGNSIVGNGTSGTGSGIEFTGSGGAVALSDITNAVFTGNTIENNKGNGIGFVNPTATAFGNTLSASFTANTITGNTGDGVDLNLVAGQQYVQASFTGNTISSNSGGPGVNIQLAQNRGVLSGSNFTGNTISSNGAQGVNFSLSGSGSVIGNFVSNTIDGNASQGVNYSMGTGNVTADFTGNTINGNGSQGLNFMMGSNSLLTNGTLLINNFLNNVIDGNVSDGVNIALNTGATFTGNNWYGNTIGTTTSKNGDAGIRLTVADGGSFNWTLGNASQAANSIGGNTNVGVGIIMSGASTGTLTIANTAFNNTVAGTDSNFAGEGLKVIEGGNAVLTGSITQSQFSNNAGDGAFFDVTGTATGTFGTLHNFTVGGATAALGNTFTNNGANGLEFVRSDYGEINNITVQFNTIDSNNANGLVVRALNQLLTDTYTINNNDISKNGANGVLFDEQADARISANMTMNTIEKNGSNGIELIEKINFITDHRALSGTWTLNTITGNGGNGIALNGATNGLVIGDPTNLAIGNVISMNDRSGILVTGAGSATIGSNYIQFNGSQANFGIDGQQDGGVVMRVAPFSNIVVENNVVTNNIGDGVQWEINPGFATTKDSSEVQIIGNTITQNSGRGIDVINRGDNTSVVNIDTNMVAGNGQEGIYVINTSSTDQAQIVNSNTALLADGAVNATPELILRVVGNQIIGNGSGSQLTATGLVIRVGTADGGNGANDPGGFASTGTPVAQGSSFATFLSSISIARAGVIAQVDNNSLGGNFGDDILFTSFTSTVNPITAAGTWTAPPAVPTQTVTAYQSDPLSRFDLYFRNNTTDPNSLDGIAVHLNTGGTFNPGQLPAAPNPSLVAFYNDADGVFKSRLNSITPTTNAGPFDSATRIRNATREAALFTPPTPNDGSNTTPVLYPGIGPSTWRASADSEPVLFTQQLLLPADTNDNFAYQWDSF